jgi:hypothetical protein
MASCCYSVVTYVSTRVRVVFQEWQREHAVTAVEDRLELFLLYPSLLNNLIVYQPRSFLHEI